MAKRFKQIKRIIITILIIVVCFLLECTVFKQINPFAVAPNLLIVVTSSFGFIRGKTEGLLVGFLCGLLRDVFFGDLLGFYALIYMVLGYCNGYFKQIFYDDDIKLPICLITASDFLFGNIVYLFMFVLRRRFNYFAYMKQSIMPELIYTIIITVVLYTIILKINQKLEANEKRSASKFV